MCDQAPREGGICLATGVVRVLRGCVGLSRRASCEAVHLKVTGATGPPTETRRLGRRRGPVPPFWPVSCQGTARTEASSGKRRKAPLPVDAPHMHQAPITIRQRLDDVQMPPGPIEACGTHVVLLLS